MFIAVRGVKHYAHFYTWSEALCSLLYKIVKLCAHCYTWNEAICSLLYM